MSQVVVKELPQIEFVLGWDGYSPGQKIRPAGVLREFLISHGYARMVEEKRKRGRPRKVR